jgi:hypothetical protein
MTLQVSKVVRTKVYLADSHPPMPNICVPIKSNLGRRKYFFPKDIIVQVQLDTYTSFEKI